MLAEAARARLPRARDRPVRLRALGRPRARGRPDRPAAHRRDDPGLRPRDLLRRRRDLGRVGAALRRRRRVVVDNSSKWRRDPEVPLVVSEVNPEALDGHKGLIANPNCSTMQLMVALKPIHDAAGIERLIVSTYQSVSGTGVEGGRGARGPDPRGAAREELPAAEVYPHPIAFNVLGGAGNFADGDDHTDEERKMMFETRKILGDESIAITVTCARVPVTYSTRSRSTLQTREPLEVEEARALLEAHARAVSTTRSSTLPDRARRRRPRRRLRRPPAPRPVARARAAACGSSRTTCSRARRPTRSRSPSVLHERGLVGARGRGGRSV